MGRHPTGFHQASPDRPERQPSRWGPCPQLSIRPTRRNCRAVASPTPEAPPTTRAIRTCIRVFLSTHCLPHRQFLVGPKRDRGRDTARPHGPGPRYSVSGCAASSCSAAGTPWRSSPIAPPPARPAPGGRRRHRLRTHLVPPADLGRCWSTTNLPTSTWPPSPCSPVKEIHVPHHPDHRRHRRPRPRTRRPARRLAQGARLGHSPAGRNAGSRRRTCRSAQGIEHRAVHGVVGPELQHVQQFDQPGPVVVRIRLAQCRFHGALIRRPRGFECRDQVPQHRLRGHKEHGVAHQLVPGVHGGETTDTYRSR